jgi:hypothetical protein
MIGVSYVTLATWLSPDPDRQAVPGALASDAIRRFIGRYRRAARGRKAVPRQVWTCPACAHTGDRKAVELVLLDENTAIGALYECPECRGAFVEIKTRDGATLRRVEAAREDLSRERAR